jgi:hypothetical protein
LRELGFIAVDVQADYRIVAPDAQPAKGVFYKAFGQGAELTTRRSAILEGREVPGRLSFRDGNRSWFRSRGR